MRKGGWAAVEKLSEGIAKPEVKDQVAKELRKINRRMKIRKRR